MLFKETLFKIISLTLVGIGFTAAVAGADKTGAQNTVRAIEEIVSQIRHAQEVNNINNLKGSESLISTQPQVEGRSLLSQSSSAVHFAPSTRE